MHADSQEALAQFALKVIKDYKILDRIDEWCEDITASEYHRYLEECGITVNGSIQPEILEMLK